MEPTEEPGAPRVLRPGEVMRVVLPAFVGSAVVAAIGIVLVLVGQRTVGVALVAVAALGGMALRTRMVFQAQQRASRGEPPR